MKMTWLKHITLQFSQCGEISDEGLTYLSKGFKAFPLLRSLNLSFSRNTKITQNGKDNITQALKEVLCLGCVSITF